MTKPALEWIVHLRSQELPNDNFTTDENAIIGYWLMVLQHALERWNDSKSVLIKPDVPEAR